MKPLSPHNSQRGVFAQCLHDEMTKDSRIHFLTADLGYGMLDRIRDDFPDRFHNCGAAEQLMLGAAVGLALSGKIPFCYSITPFLLYRPFEWIRNYLQHEKIPVRLVGSGLHSDYKHDGHTHHAQDAIGLMTMFPSIETYYPETTDDVPRHVRSMLERPHPAFICLRR